MHLMAQRAVADILFRDRLLADQGFLSRVLVSAPDSAMGSRLSHQEGPDTDRDLTVYHVQLLQILRAPLPLVPGKANELSPRDLPLSATAEVMWRGFADHVETEIAPGGSLEPVRGFANKLPEHAARLAAVLTLVQDIHATEIADFELAAGIELAQHYTAEALRLHGASGISEALRRAHELLDWLLVRWDEPLVSLADVYQFGPNSIRDADTSRRAIAVVEEHGWLVRIPKGAIVRGVRRKDVWKIVRG
jgi:hypothetical protein